VQLCPCNRTNEERSSGGLGWRWGGEQHPHQDAQKPLQARWDTALERPKSSDLTRLDDLPV